MNKKNNYTIEYEDSGLRIDVYLCNIYPDLSRSYLQKQIKEGNILVNNANVKSSYILKTDDVVAVDINNESEPVILPQNIPVDIMYEDSQILVVYKPSGMLTHPTSTEKSGTLVNALLYYTNSKLAFAAGIDRPGIVHRLDRNTSGLLMVAKNDEAYFFLKKQMQNRTIEKKYYAIVCGIPQSSEDTIITDIGRHPTKPEKMAVISNGKQSITHYKVIDTFNNFALLDVTLETGRTHQIRVHMSHIGHPIVNDTLYGGKSLPVNSNEQALQAYSLSFVSPEDNEQKHIVTGFDNDIIKTINYLRCTK